MIKNIIVGALALIVIGAVGVGVYDAFSGTPAEAETVVASSSDGNRGQGVAAQAGPLQAGQALQASGPATVNGQPGTGEPQSVPSTEWTTLSAEVQVVEVNGLSVLTADGQPLWIQLGPTHFWSGAITFAVGDTVSVTGFTENGQFMAAVIDNDTTGQSFTLRSETGQPLWAGGANGGNGNNNNGNGNGGKGNGNGRP